MLCCTAVVLPCTVAVSGVFNQINVHLSKYKNVFPLTGSKACAISVSKRINQTSAKEAVLPCLCRCCVIAFLGDLHAEKHASF